MSGSLLHGTHRDRKAATKASRYTFSCENFQSPATDRAWVPPLGPYAREA